MITSIRMQPDATPFGALWMPQRDSWFPCGEPITASVRRNNRLEASKSALAGHLAGVSMAIRTLQMDCTSGATGRRIPIFVPEEPLMD